MLGELIINGLLLPGAAALVFIVLAARTGHRWLQAFGVAAALVAASIGLSGLPEASPTDALGHMPYLALATAPVAIFTTFFRESWQGWVVRFVFVLIGVGVIAEPMGLHTWSQIEGLAWWAGLSMLITAAWLSIERLVVQQSSSSEDSTRTERRGRRRRSEAIQRIVERVTSLSSRPIARRGLSKKPMRNHSVADGLDVAQAAAVTIGLGGGAAAAAAISTLVLGIHVGAMATAVALVGLYAWRSSSPTGLHAVSTLVPIVGFLWVITFLYGGIPGASMVLIAFAPLLALGALGLGRRMERSKLGLAVASTLAIVAIGSSVLVAEQPAAEINVEADDGLDADSGAYYPY